MKNKKKFIIIGIVVLIVIANIVGLYLAGVFDSKEPVTPVTPEPDLEPQVEVLEPQPERDLWLSNKALNSDYLGEIVFDSGIINKSFVQAKDVYDENGDLYHFYTEHGSLVTDPSNMTGNDVYIWTNWKDMTWDYNIEGGSVFMDYRNELEDQNLIIYGHHFSVEAGNDPERVKAFTPLENWLKGGPYNETVKLVLDNETRTYELAYVYKFDLYDDFYYDNCQYFRTEYNYDEFEGVVDDSYYQKYINAMEQVKLFDTGVKLTTDDRTLTLQTCVTGAVGQVFEVCVFKEVNVEHFSD